MSVLPIPNWIYSISLIPESDATQVTCHMRISAATWKLRNYFTCQAEEKWSINYNNGVEFWVVQSYRLDLQLKIVIAS